MSHVQASLADYKIKRDELLALYPALAEDEQALNDTLDGVTTLEDQISALIRKGLEFDAMVEALGGMIKMMQARKQRLERSSENVRDAVLHVMQEAGRVKIISPDVTISVGKGKPKVIITDESAVPVDYKIEKPRELDKNLIKQALADGYEVPGATLSNATPILTVRRT